MPFPSNWLEELVAEWLELEGFLTLIHLPAIGLAGGVQPPDVVGARIGAGGRVEIRHCETTMWFAQGVGAAAVYETKFSQNIRNQVWEEFSRVFGAAGPPDYEPWIICCEVGAPVAAALHQAVESLQLQDPNLQDLQLCNFSDFLPRVRATIGNWRQDHAQTPGLPQGSWLLILLDYMNYYGLWP